jgi:putative ABC transport system permease protein
MKRKNYFHFVVGRAIASLLIGAVCFGLVTLHLSNMYSNMLDRGFEKRDEMMKKLNESAEDRVQSIEESIAETFKDQQHTLKLITLFTLIAIVVSVMGFIGMSLFFIRQRQKDIGIRKIMGSTSSEVMMLMLRTFCVPLLVSFVMAIPLSWYVMNDWLSNFSYRISLSPWIFVATCAFSLLVAVLSVSIQIMKAVRTNPVESIKTE